MQTRLTINELWPLTEEEAAQKIVAFLRELEIERRTGGTGLDLFSSVQELMAKKDIKQQILEKYARKEPHPFYQFDGWADQSPGDYVMVPDEEGDVLMGGETDELMDTCPDVRVLVPPGTDNQQAARLLRKIAAWIERGYAQEITEKLF